MRGVRGWRLAGLDGLMGTRVQLRDLTADMPAMLTGPPVCANWRVDCLLCPEVWEMEISSTNF